jgi:hypothetical protein
MRSQADSVPHAVIAHRPAQVRSTSDRRRLLWMLLWIAGWLAAAVSICAGLRNSALHSQDFQWSPTHLLLQHIDPWHEFLVSGVRGRIILDQVPNYLHLLYLLLSPLGFLTFSTARVVWAACNLGFTALSLLLTRKLFQQTQSEWGILCVLFLCSTPFRNCLGNGQQTLLIILFVAMAFNASGAWQEAICCGMSYCKYSFAPPLFLELVLRRGPIFAVISLLPAAGGLFWAFWMLRGRLLTLAIEPLLVSRTGMEGSGDIMSVVDSFFPKHSAVLYLFLEYCIPLAVCSFLIWYARGKRADLASSQIMVAVASTASLLCFKHASYDYAMLLFPFALGLKYRAGSSGRLIVMCVIYLWFVTRFVGGSQNNYNPWMTLSNLIILASISFLLLRINREVQPDRQGSRTIA